MPLLGPGEIESVESNGFVVTKPMVDDATCDRLGDHLDSMEVGTSAKRRRGETYALRNVLQLSPLIREIAADGTLGEAAREVLGPRARAVRGIFFDKKPEANWSIPWHQDAAVAVKGDARPEGFSQWTTKSGVLHAVPPLSILSCMVTMRLHLDDCTLENGPLEVIAGTHREIMDSVTIADAAATRVATTCITLRGGIVVMRPLLVHRSRASTAGTRRRTLHIEFAACDLPSGLAWAVEPAG